MAASSQDISKLTPMMRQYYDLKSQCEDAILLFRMGDFYEIFGSDAETVAPKLELVLTARERGDQEKIPFCGVPHHSARNYWLKLVRMGFKVAFADQVEDPKEAKGLVKRAITKIVTPGSMSELEGLDRESANYLMALYQHPEKKHWLTAVCDVSSGELRLGTLESEAQIPEIVSRFRPKEVLARRFFHERLGELLSSYKQEEQLLFGQLPEANLRNAKAQEAWFEKAFGQSLASMPCQRQEGGEVLLASLFGYLTELFASVEQFVSVRPLFEPDTMILDETARRDLELFETARSRRAQGSLYYEINRTLSPMGARLLKSYLLLPLTKVDLIVERQRAVAELRAMNDLRKIRDCLQNTGDLERLTTRIIGCTATPLELLKVMLTLREIPGLSQWLTTSKSKLLKTIRDELNLFVKPLKLLEQALKDDAHSLGNGDGVFKLGFDQSLDELNQIALNGSEKVSAYEQALREKTGINSLKIKSHQTFGLLIEITKSNLSKVPKDFIRKQTMVNNERFITPELVELSEALAHAKDHALQKEGELFRNLLMSMSEFKGVLKSMSLAIAELDVLQSFAWKALESEYCVPKTSEEGSLSLQQSRHPVVEFFVGRHRFTSNNIEFKSSQKQILITGPNMAGKSTVMRQVALSAVLHQIGSCVPAREAKLPVFDRIFTRVGAADDLSRGHSTFFIEMAEAAQILRHATNKSLVILDEIGRGTSTQDGLAIASAILESIANKTDCFALFATHYHELVPFAENLGVRTMQTEVIEEEGEIRLTHRFIDGASGHSFGIEVAKIAGIPPPIIERAKELLGSHPQPASVAAVTGATISALGFEETLGESLSKSFPNNRLQEISSRLEALRIHRTTPLQALNILNDLKCILSASEQGNLFDSD